ncbi:MAG: hypothetical protein IJY90_03525 [Clostridia bacterium]|nr:hypothetical protein [Clostridia bacterium]
MDKTILELLSRFMGQQNQQTHTPAPQQNPSAANYPPEAFIQETQTQRQPQTAQNNQMFNMLSAIMGGGAGGNPLAMISSLMGKDNPLASIMAASSKKEEERTSSPKDEILL